MKTKTGLFLLIILIIAIRAGFAQEVQKKIEYPNLVKNGDFENGPTGFKSDFINHPSNDVFTWGYYVITDNVAQYLEGKVFVNPVPNTGKYYAIDMNSMGKQRLWYDSITVKPNTTYSFSCILANVNAEFQAPGVMNLKINGRKVCPSMILSNKSAAWTPFSIKYKTGPDETRIEISIVDEIWTLRGNDVALDNVVFKEIPPEEFTSSCGVIFQHPNRIEPPKRDTLGRKWAEEERKSALTDAGLKKVITNFQIEIKESSMFCDNLFMITQDSLFAKLTSPAVIKTSPSWLKYNDKFSKIISQTDRQSIIEALTKVDLGEIQKNNVDHSAPDDMYELDFKITIDGQTKEFHIYQVKIDDIFNLVKQINALLPDKFIIKYNDACFKK